MITKIRFFIKGKVSLGEINGLIDLINNCEFCNSGMVKFDLLHFDKGKKYNLATVRATSNYENLTNKLEQMFNCEFCHNDYNVQFRL
jgi:transcription elongation factor Elf1